MERKPHILVVDDDRPILILMERILREFDFEASTAASGSEALELAASHPPDLALVDINMPEMPGDEVCRRLREQQGSAMLPVIILSGEPVPQGELERVGAVASIQKPFELPELLALIRRHLAPVRQER
jgi:DNA-binding response OmpR family regulator